VDDNYFTSGKDPIYFSYTYDYYEIEYYQDIYYFVTEYNSGYDSYYRDQDTNDITEEYSWSYSYTNYYYVYETGTYE
jgi:hypothetical protein